MNETTYRVLSALSRNLGRPMSIQDLTASIRRLHGKAYYANAYHAVQSLHEQQFLSIGRLGRASVISLNFSSYRLLDLLTEMELRRKRVVLERMPRAELCFAALERRLRELPVAFALVVAAERNLRLNRVEMLVCVSAGHEAEVLEALALLSRRLTIRIDALALTEPEFLSFLSKAEHNPVQEMVAEGIALFGPQSFWATLAQAEAEGRHGRIAEPIPLARLGRTDLIFNLGRFGFPLLGGAVEGRAICIELTAAAALLSREARLRLGAAVVLSKNPFHPRVLAFLATKYGSGGALRSLLASVAPSPAVKELKALLRESRAVSPRLDKASSPKTMETYHAS